MQIKRYISLLFFILMGVSFCYQSHALLGEDLGIDFYKQIDEGFYELENKQYEYEMTGQGEAKVGDIVGPILKEEGVNCDIASTKDIERMLGNSGKDTIAFITEHCNGGAETTPTLLVSKVQNSLANIKNSFMDRATKKSQKTYEIARIGLFSDGNTENSSFDLITDLQEIDKVIFTQELKYEGNSDSVSDDAVQGFIDKTWNDPLIDLVDEETPDASGSILPETSTGSGDIVIPPILLPVIDDHRYVCAAGDSSSGLDEETENDIRTTIEGSTGTGSRYQTSFVYPTGDVSNGASWGGPFPGVGPEGEYTQTRDSWKCDPDQFFCIIIEFQKSNYGLAGGESMSIEKILDKAAGHLEKPANASLTQRKMTTNNFELGSIIKNLPDMLRGLGVDVQTKPVPILDVPSKNEGQMEGDIYEVKNLICSYYKNAGLDCERANDISEFAFKEEEQKIFQTSAGMPITYPETRNNELLRFQTAMKENNLIIDKSVDEQLLTDDMKKFGDQFTELEKFVASMKEFSMGFKGEVTKMKKIPSQTP